MMQWKVEETVTKYLNELEDHLASQKKNFVGGLARKPVGEWGSMDGAITALAPKWNPFLYMTGQSTNNWLISIGEPSFVEIMYTAMGTPSLNTARGDRNRKVWSEFGDKKKGILERDYAWFQETGEDPEAKPQDAKHQHFVELGLEASYGEIMNTSQRYLNHIIKLQKIPVRRDYVER